MVRTLPPVDLYLPPSPSQSSCIYLHCTGRADVLESLNTDPKSLVTFSPGSRPGPLGSVDGWTPLMVDPRSCICTKYLSPIPRQHLPRAIPVSYKYTSACNLAFFKPTLYSNYTRLSAGPFPVPPKRQISSSSPSPLEAA